MGARYLVLGSIQNARYQTVFIEQANVNLPAVGAVEVVGIVKLLLVCYQTVFNRLV